MRFIWDPAKAVLNYIKHGVSFGDAITAFDDGAGMYVPDRKYPERGNLIGLSSATQLLFVVHVELLTETPPATRIISARKADGPERRLYYARFEQPSKKQRRQQPRRERRSSEPPRPKQRPKQRRRHHEEE